jgi:hypothetical protein
MEKDVEARLREKYALIDKNDVEQLAEAQKAGLSLAGDENMLLGDSDGQNFGVGLAPKDVRAKKDDLLKITRRNRSKAGTKTSSSPQLDQQQKTSVQNANQKNQSNGSSKDSDSKKDNLNLANMPPQQQKEPSNATRPS